MRRVPYTVANRDSFFDDGREREKSNDGHDGSPRQLIFGGETRCNALTFQTSYLTIFSTFDVINGKKLFFISAHRTRAVKTPKIMHSRV